MEGGCCLAVDLGGFGGCFSRGHCVFRGVLGGSLGGSLGGFFRGWFRCCCREVLVEEEDEEEEVWLCLFILFCLFRLLCLLCLVMFVSFESVYLVWSICFYSSVDHYYVSLSYNHRYNNYHQIINRKRKKNGLRLVNGQGNLQGQRKLRTP